MDERLALGRPVRLLAALTLFLTFFPYPAIAVGRSTGIQVGTLSCAVLLAFTFLNIPRNHAVAYATLAFPYIVSGAVVVFAGLALDEAIAEKQVIVQAISVMPVVLPGLLA